MTRLEVLEQRLAALETEVAELRIQIRGPGAAGPAQRATLGRDPAPTPTRRPEQAPATPPPAAWSTPSAPADQASACCAADAAATRPTGEAAAGDRLLRALRRVRARRRRRDRDRARDRLLLRPRGEPGLDRPRVAPRLRRRRLRGRLRCRLLAAQALRDDARGARRGRGRNRRRVRDPARGHRALRVRAGPRRPRRCGGHRRRGDCRRPPLAGGARRRPRPHRRAPRPAHDPRRRGASSLSLERPSPRSSSRQSRWWRCASAGSPS